MNKKTENLERELELLAALRNATDVTQAWLPLSTPVYDIRQLADRGWLPPAALVPGSLWSSELRAAAARLVRQGLAGRRTLSGRPNWFIMDEGRALLARLEKAAGLAELHAAQAQVWEAEEAERRARERRRRAELREAELLDCLPRRESPMSLLLAAAAGKAVSL